MDEYTPREVASTVATNQETSNTGESGERFGTGSQNSGANFCTFFNRQQVFGFHNLHVAGDPASSVSIMRLPPGSLS
jgi:hypothetical protein